MIGISADGALSPHAFRARTRTNAASDDTGSVWERRVPGTTSRARSTAPLVRPTSITYSSTAPVAGGDQRALTEGAVHNAHGACGGPGGATQGAVVTLITADGSLTPPAVAERTRTSHTPVGTRVATKDGTSVRATGTNAGLRSPQPRR